MTSNRPTEQPQGQASSEKWNTPETWASVATALVLIPMALLASRAAVDAGVSHWMIAAAAAVISVTAVVLLDDGTGLARDGVLFGLFITFMLTATSATANALDVGEGWVIWAVVVLVVAVKWLRNRNRDEGRSYQRAGD